MWRYQWPGYEMQLLGELQRQQNNSRFCDTLLQTEGISVPTHSCILAALSPYLSWKLSSSPPPPFGQKYQLQLKDVKAQTLLKLVGLLYSGKLEAKGSVEQTDVLALARQFGITVLLEDGGMWRAELQERRWRSPVSERGNGLQAEKRKRDDRRPMKDAQVQTEMDEMREMEAPAEKRSCTFTGTQIVKAGERLLVRCDDSTQGTPPTPDPGAQSLEISVMLQSQTVTHVEQFSSMCYPVIPSIHSGTLSGGNCPLNQSARIGTNRSSTLDLSNDMLTSNLFRNDDSISQRHLEDNTVKQSSGFEDSARVLTGTNSVNGKRHGETADRRQDTEQPSRFNSCETPEEDRAKSPGKRPVFIALKSLAKMKQMQEMTESPQNSVKVKLRRTTKGKEWEVMSEPDSDDTMSSLISLNQPKSVRNQGSMLLQSATTNFNKSPRHPNTYSDAQTPSSNCFTPNQNNDIEASLPLHGQGTVDESDEQIEKLLEDIMMGLNILPNLEQDCRLSEHVKQSRDGGSSVCQVPVTHKETGHSHVHAAVSSPRCELYQDLETPTCSSTDTDQNRARCSALSSDTALIRHQQECSSEYHSLSLKKHKRTTLSKTQESVPPAESTVRSLIPSSLYSAGQKICIPEFQEPSLQQNLRKHDVFPVTSGNEPKALQTLPFPYPADLRFPRCLSPIEPCTSTNDPFVLNNSVNIGNTFQQQPPLQRRPRLTVNSGSVQIPPCRITNRESKSESLPQDTNGCCGSKPRQEHVNPLNADTSAGGPCAVEELAKRKTASADDQNLQEPKPKPRKMKERDTRVKTKCTSHPLDVVGSVLTYKDVKISDATQRKFNLGICKVKLSSNNLLAKERENAAKALNISNATQPMIITESLRRSTRRSGLSTERSQIKTREFVKINQEPRCPEIVAQPVAQIVLKRGRPPKTKCRGLADPKNNPVDEKDSHDKGSHQQTLRLSKDDLAKGRKTQQRCKKRLNSSGDAAEVPLKKTTKVDCQLEADKKPQVCKRQQMIILKELQKRINNKKSKEKQQTNKPEPVAGSEWVATFNSTFKKSTEVLVKDVDRSGNEESQAVRTIDTNHNEVFKRSTDKKSKSHSKESGSSKRKKTKLMCGGKLPAADGSDLSADRKQLLNPDEAHDTGASNTLLQTAPHDDEGSSHSDLHQTDKHSGFNRLPQTPEETGPRLSEAAGISTTPGREEEEEEEEVDVLLYSPVHLQTKEHRLTKVEIIPDEEEEEDVNETDMIEIDVTGD